MILHTFGDSHCFFPWNMIEIDNLIIKTHHLGPKTCASFGLEKLNLINIKNMGVDEGDAVCFCFGEIDCRSHMCKPQNYEIYKTLINEIVFRYFEAIKLNVEQYKNIIILIFNVVPAIKVTEKTPENLLFPYIGSDEERKTVTLYMNGKLKEYCKKNNYLYLDVYDKYCDENGLLNINFSDNNVHIKNEIYILEFLNELFK